jgi:hypothetical protein
MLAAQAKGYSLPSGFIDEWKRYQKQKAVNWSPDPRTISTGIIIIPTWYRHIVYTCLLWPVRPNLVP